MTKSLCCVVVQCVPRLSQYMRSAFFNRKVITSRPPNSCLNRYVYGTNNYDNRFYLLESLNGKGAIANLTSRNSNKREISTQTVSLRFREKLVTPFEFLQLDRLKAAIL